MLWCHCQTNNIQIELHEKETTIWLPKHSTDQQSSNLSIKQTIKYKIESNKKCNLNGDLEKVHQRKTGRKWMQQLEWEIKNKCF